MQRRDSDSAGAKLLSREPSRQRQDRVPSMQRRDSDSAGAKLSSRGDVEALRPPVSDLTLPVLTTVQLLKWQTNLVSINKHQYCRWWKKKEGCRKGEACKLLQSTWMMDIQDLIELD